LKFGAYLEIIADGYNLKYAPETLTERRFRDAWRAVGKGHAKETHGRAFPRCRGGQGTSRHLRLGAYLEIMPSWHNLKYARETLTEGRFRDAWRAVGKTVLGGGGFSEFRESPSAVAASPD
jgi:hypothetical protein